MTPATRHAALRATAAVATATALGCAASPPPTAPTEPITPSTGAPSAAPSSVATSPKRSCNDVIAEALPPDGPYPGVKANVSAEARRCCAEQLEHFFPAGPAAIATHRWSCCANLEPSDEDKVGSACTPWGPPVPPPMRA